MVKVIKKGVKEIDCWKCKSTLEYCESEVERLTTNHDYTGDYDVIYGIKCPVCDNKIDTRE